MIELTWTCHICGEERPDSMIAVFQKPLVVNGQLLGTQNIRYCKDRPACFDGAKQFSFLPDEQETQTTGGNDG